MALPIPIIGSIIEIFSKGIDKLIPDVNERERLKHEMQKFLIELPFEQWKLFEARLLAEIQNPVWYRDIVRPFITFSSWALYCYVKWMVISTLHAVYVPILAAIPKTPENVMEIKLLLAEYITSIFTWYDLMIITGILGFWFGPKAFERVIEKFSNLKSIKSAMLGNGNGNGNGIA